MSTSPFISPDQSGHVIKSELIRFRGVVVDRYRISLPRVEVRWDLKGRSAGMARGVSLIRLNPDVGQAHPDRVLDVLAHEYAHLVKNAIARVFAGQRKFTQEEQRPHGAIWQDVVRTLGYEPARCLSVPSMPSRNIRRFPYQCGCRTHQVSIILHHRMLQGKAYACEACNGVLRPV